MVETLQPETGLLVKEGSTPKGFPARKATSRWGPLCDPHVQDRETRLAQLVKRLVQNGVSCP